MKNSRGNQYDFLRKTEIKNFIDENILGPTEHEKVISKQLIQMILPIQKRPFKILESGNQLIKYLRYNAQSIVEEFISIYLKKDVFKLTKYGQYCAEDNQKYIIFSEFMICFLSIQNKKWSGFCYYEGKSAYIGQFNNMLSDGQGKGLFQIEHTHHNINTKKTIYHEYQGQWRAGQIINGTRKSYQIYGKLPFMQYTGSFQNFCFHGEKGVLKTREKTQEGRFVKGVLINSNNSAGNS